MVCPFARSKGGSSSSVAALIAVEMSASISTAWAIPHAGSRIITIASTRITILSVWASRSALRPAPRRSAGAKSPIARSSSREIVHAIHDRHTAGRIAPRSIWWKPAPNPKGAGLMEIIPLRPGFAAELRGLSLSEIAANAAYNEARAAFEQHSVLVFRDQEVTDEAQLAFSRRFGPLEVTKVGSQGVGTNLVILSTIDANGKVVPADHRLALRNKANQLWHTDSTFKRTPALASVLSARIIPARGGQTEFVSTRLAWARLDPGLRARIENCFVWHDYAHSRGKIAPDLAGPEERAALRPQCWRMTWKNPANGRTALYLASHACAIEGMEQGEAQKLLAELMDAATAPGLSYEHAWRSGDVVMWDNRATMHRGRPWPANEPRLMVRTTISATDADGLAGVRPPS